MAVEISGDTGVSRAQPTALPFLVGQVCFFAQNAVPAGFLKANGATVSRTAYADLFAAIGTAYGAGDGSTTFQLPDFRGEFPRGWDDGRGADSGRAFGSWQAHDWKGFEMTNTGQGISSGYSHGPVNMGKNVSPDAFVGVLFTGAWSTPAAAIGTRWDTSEIRPRNIAVLACIKY